MCTIKEIREAIREDCSSQHDMDSAEIDRVLQALPFSQDSEPFSKPRPQRPVFWFHTRRYTRMYSGGYESAMRIHKIPRVNQP